MDTRQAADILGCTTSAVVGMIERGLFPSVQPHDQSTRCKRYRVPVIEVQRIAAEKHRSAAARFTRQHDAAARQMERAARMADRAEPVVDRAEPVVDVGSAPEDGETLQALPVSVTVGVVAAAVQRLGREVSALTARVEALEDAATAPRPAEGAQVAPVADQLRELTELRAALAALVGR